MKKNLTLLVMLAAFVGIVSAQTGPKFNYQAVVRHQDTLFHDQTVNVTILVLNGTDVVYTENFTGVPTTENGLISIVIGESGSGSLFSVDWANATVVGQIDLGLGEPALVVSMPVTAVPYAFQAPIAPLTTEMIADYAENRITNDGMTQILDAIRHNPNGLKNGLKHMVIEYMKNHKDIAKEVAGDYLDHLDPHNVREAYEAVTTNLNEPQLRNKLRHLLLINRPLTKDLAIWFMETATQYDVNRTYQTILSVPEASKQAFWTRLVNYASSPANRSYVYELGIFFINDITSEEAYLMYNHLKQTNPDVHAQFRDVIDFYVDMYMSDPANAGKATVTMDAVDHAIDNYIQSKPRIPVPTDCSIDVCNIKSLYDAVAP